MFSTGGVRRAFCFASALAALAAAAAAQSTDATLFRVFLRDGSTLVSYGEYARVADRVIVTLPLGGAATAPDLQVLSIPADTVDWEKTDAYADSARAARYAVTSGPNDYALLSESVNRALGDIVLTAESARKISMAQEARQNVMKWASEHYGYRAPDVARLASLFDDVVVETRRASGEKNVELNLVANMAAPPDTPLLPQPSLRDTVEGALRAVTLAPDATERTSLLKAIEKTLAGAGADAAPWAAPLHARTVSALAIEEQTDRAYTSMTSDALRSADRYVRTGDVTGVERAVRLLMRQDDRLGQRRPQEMAAALATLDTKLDAARRERLARDNRAARAEVLAQYKRAIAEPLALMRQARPALDEIRRLAGPSRERLARLPRQLTTISEMLEKISVPEEVTAPHDLFKTSVQLAKRAADGRQRAVLAGSMPAAQDASSAAAGALMLFEKAAADLQTLLK